MWQNKRLLFFALSIALALYSLQGQTVEGHPSSYKQNFVVIEDIIAPSLSEYEQKHIYKSLLRMVSSVEDTHLLIAQSAKAAFLSGPLYAIKLEILPDSARADIFEVKVVLFNENAKLVVRKVVHHKTERRELLNKIEGALKIIVKDIKYPE